MISLNGPVHEQDQVNHKAPTRNQQKKVLHLPTFSLKKLPV